MRLHDMNWQAWRPICSTTIGSSCRSARRSSTDTSRSARTRSWPSGCRSRRRSHSACRCCRSLPVRAGAVLHGLPGQPDAADGDLPRGRARPARLASPLRASGGSRSSTGTAATPRGRARRGVGRRAARAPGAGGVHSWYNGARTEAAAAELDRRPQPRRPGWRTSRGPASRASRSPDERKPTADHPVRSMREADTAPTSGESARDGSLGGLYAGPTRGHARRLASRRRRGPRPAETDGGHVSDAGWTAGSPSSPARRTGSGPRSRQR